MELKNTAKISFFLLIFGLVAFYIWMPLPFALWFGVGGGLTLLNVYFAIWAIRFGLGTLQKKSVFLGVLLIKSLSFVLAVAAILMFLKPLLLPFTLGIGLVIFGALGAALWEILKQKKKD